MDVRACFERFVTTELTTVDARQQPITWPVTPYYRDGGPTIDVTTGLGYPKKADDARRHPRVALLFSDPTGSGLERPAQVLVQGIAAVDEDDLAANRERYMRESVAKLPATRKMHPPSRCESPSTGTTPGSTSGCARSASSSGPPATRSPSPRSTTRISRRSARDIPRSRPSPTSRRPADRWPGTLGSRSWGAAIRWPSSPGSGPTASRSRSVSRSHSTRPPTGSGSESSRSGLPLAEGRACITAHAHGPEFEWQENFQVRGDLVALGQGEWALVPRKLIGGFELPRGLGRYRSILSRHWRFYRTARARMRARAG